MDETNNFLKEFEPTKDDVFTQTTEEVVTTETKTEEESDESPRNRRERRLQSKLQAERESGIAMAARLATLTEVQKMREDSEPSEYLKKIERIYGTDSPEALAATDLLKSAFKDVEEISTNRALEKFREEQRKAQEAEKNAARELDSMVEIIEDELNVELTEVQQKGFFKLLEKMSPKDSEGNIVAYADPISVWEVYAEKTKQAPDTRAKDLSSRSMTQSGASKEGTGAQDAATRFLIENGII